MGKPTRTCLDCRRPSNDFEWCDICEGIVCFDCDDLHDCTGELSQDQEPGHIEAEWRELFSNKKKPSDYN